MNTTQNLKQNIKKSAKVFSDEPLELLKTARKQITGEEYNDSFEESDRNQQVNTKPSEEEEEYKKLKTEQEGRHLEALESELGDIRREKLFKSLMDRIQNGETVPLEEFGSLSYEQKEVLKAQMEAVKTRNSQEDTEKQLIEPAPKKGRRLFGQKESAQKQTTRVEKPVPPSG